MKTTPIVLVVIVAFLLGFSVGRISLQPRLSELEKFEVRDATAGTMVKYSELRVGEWKVVVVVDKYTNTAVVRNLPYHDERPTYVLVTDMVPSMVEEGYEFRVSGTK